MKIVKFEGKTELKVKNIRGFMKRKVVVSGTSAKINVPKEYLGCDTYLVILENESRKKGERIRRKTKANARSVEQSSSKN